MTAQDHNKVIGIMQLIWGGFHTLMMALIIPFMWFVLDMIGRDPQAPPEMRMFFNFFAVFYAVIAVVFGVPPIIAGYAMLKRKSWARVMGIVSACLTAMSFPFGTALCVYTMWFMFGQGEQFYRGYDAPPAPPNYLKDAGSYNWDAQRARDSRREQTEYAPPPQPPDWRG